MLIRFPVGDGGEALSFVPVEVAQRLTALSSLTTVPGTRPPIAGIALADGAVVTVLSLGQAVVNRGAKRSYEPGEDWVVPGAESALLCRLDGCDVALTGATVLATGVFDVAPDGSGILWRGSVVEAMDVRALYAQAEATTWVPQAVSTTSRPAPAAPEEYAERAALLPDPPASETGGGR